MLGCQYSLQILKWDRLVKPRKLLNIQLRDPRANMAGLPRNLFCSGSVGVSLPSSPPTPLDTQYAGVKPWKDRGTRGSPDSFPWRNSSSDSAHGLCYGSPFHFKKFLKRLAWEGPQMEMNS